VQRGAWSVEYHSLIGREIDVLIRALPDRLRRPLSGVPVVRPEVPRAYAIARAVLAQARCVSGNLDPPTNSILSQKQGCIAILGLTGDFFSHSLLEAEEFLMKRSIYISMIAAALFALQTPGAAKASTLAYNLVLNPLSGLEAGTGSFTIVAPQVGSSGVLTQGNHLLTAMDFKIDGLDFKLNDTSEVTYFYQGSTLILSSLAYSGKIGVDRLFAISLDGVGGYIFTDGVPGDHTLGSLSVSATPIPTTLPLLATGLGVIAMLGLWKKRKVAVALAT
jgi:hypothetical protein